MVKNFYYETKYQKIKPLVILNINRPNGSKAQYLSIRVKSDNDKQMISELARIWDQYSMNIPFDYTFLDKRYEAMYSNEIYLKKLFFGFSILSIFIACLGLLGLVTYMIQQRTKEMGIRKTFGASTYKIVLLLAKNLMKWILISNVLAWPLAWYFFDQWLNKFAYRCDILWWYFPVAGILSLFIAIIPVSYQTIKSASTNPIDSLRYE